MRKVIALFLHCPLNTTFFRKNLPAGTYMTAGLTDSQALAHADKKASVESVLPSPLAPKLTTLYVDTATAAALLPNNKTITSTPRTTRIDPLIIGISICGGREREIERFNIVAKALEKER
ncbi:hypothetical protein TorRG33x02_028470 [Trema orientale]|uniref:Uncharacterized protein n=1 Tax=Trema orientale TaxID=63057 RepID=A0A2P5FUS2_TREOI|nr:hypothetical protein TorRG33x02_028470 [Trema orientale]